MSVIHRLPRLVCLLIASLALLTGFGSAHAIRAVPACCAAGMGCDEDGAMPSCAASCLAGCAALPLPDKVKANRVRAARQRAIAIVVRDLIGIRVAPAIPPPRIDA